MSTVTAPKENERMSELLKKDEVSVAEAAELLGLSRQAVYTLIEQEDLDISRRKTAKRGIFVSIPSVVKYIKNVQLRHIPSSYKK